MDCNCQQLGKLLDLDKVIHERARLGIMAALSVSEMLTFGELKRVLSVTDGNLSVHLKLLEKKRYVNVNKQFVGKKPKSTYSLTLAGKRAFEDYLNQMEKFIHDLQRD